MPVRSYYQRQFVSLCFATWPGSASKQLTFGSSHLRVCNNSDIKPFLTGDCHINIRRRVPTPTHSGPKFQQPCHHTMSTSSSSDQDSTNIDTYNTWLIKKTEDWKKGKKSSSALAASLVTADTDDMPEAPKFEFDSLFHEMVEEYASRMTSLSSDDFRIITDETEKAGLYAPCMVGKLEGQFLKMLARVKKAKRVLDIGTFTGFSALAFAEALPHDGKVITIEADAKTAAVARICFERAKHGNKIQLLECDARAEVEKMADSGEKFDIVFLDADKTNYRHYYEAGLRMIDDDGVLMADNALCSLVYPEGDPARQSLHEFAEFVRTDDRVEQVMMTVREGILVVQKRSQT